MFTFLCYVTGNFQCVLKILYSSIIFMPQRAAYNSHTVRSTYCGVSAITSVLFAILLYFNQTSQVHRHIKVSRRTKVIPGQWLLMLYICVLTISVPFITGQVFSKRYHLTDQFFGRCANTVNMCSPQGHCIFQSICPITFPVLYKEGFRLHSYLKWKIYVRFGTCSGLFSFDILHI